MYKSSLGKWAYQAGTSGTVTLPKGAKLLQIITEGASGATVAIFGGTAIPCVSAAPKHFRFLHGMAAAPSATNTIVFTSTVSYFVEYAGPGNP